MIKTKTRAVTLIEAIVSISIIGVTIGITLDKDENQDNKTESSLTTEVMPTPLYLKRRP